MIQIFDCQQGTPEWFACRAGIPTASEFSTVMAKGRDGGKSKTRDGYLRKLAGEVITGESVEGYSNAHMERGKVMEAEARDLYAFMKDVEPRLVGFIRNGDAGYSPDSLIAHNGAAEVKTKLPHLQIEVLKRNDVPPEHVAQVQGGIWVGELEWLDFISYWPKLPIFIRRVYRDEAYIKSLAASVKTFNEELAELVGWLRNYQEAA
jgi:hypothetical protein